MGKPCCQSTNPNPPSLVEIGVPRPEYDTAAVLKQRGVRESSLHIADCANLAIAAVASSSAGPRASMCW